MPTTQPLSIDYSGIASVLGQIVAIIVAITALYQVVGAKRKAEDAKTDAGTAKATSEKADVKADLANERSSNNAQAITGVQNTLGLVALQTPPIPKSPVPPVEFPGGPG